MEIDLGPENQFYSPNGGNARLYFSAVTGTDQGEYFEAIIGTAGNDVMTDVGGAGVNKFWGMDGDDTMTAAAGTVSVLVGGKGEDTLTGAELEDTLRGGSGDDIMDGGAGVDIVRYDRGDASETATHGVFVNLSDSDVTYDFNSELGVTVAAGHAIDKWGDLDTLTNIENVRGSSLDDIIVGSDDDNVIMGDQGNDIFQGNDGVDTYIWRAGDGYDTIIGDDSSQDVIQFDVSTISTGTTTGMISSLASSMTRIMNLPGPSASKTSQPEATASTIWKPTSTITICTTIQAVKEQMRGFILARLMA